ncbi:MULTISPECIES: hypothetical protein [unclassified Streptomyces]|uniref:hypothetical protein n=1 Tax=unclassified Streptomyces TaxID=2593676 RepID=UPI0033E89BE6
MHRRIAALAVTACAATALLLGSASTASAVPPGFYVRSHHASLAECEAAGQAGGDIWGALYFCTPFQGKAGVYELWVRY